VQRQDTCFRIRAFVPLVDKVIDLVRQRMTPTVEVEEFWSVWYGHRINPSPWNCLLNQAPRDGIKRDKVLASSIEDFDFAVQFVPRVQALAILTTPSPISWTNPR
jgi:hypothetical protein